MNKTKETYIVNTDLTHVVSQITQIFHVFTIFFCYPWKLCYRYSWLISIVNNRWLCQNWVHGKSLESLEKLQRKMENSLQLSLKLEPYNSTFIGWLSTAFLEFLFHPWKFNKLLNLEKIRKIHLLTMFSYWYKNLNPNHEIDMKYLVLISSLLAQYKP